MHLTEQYTSQNQRYHKRLVWQLGRSGFFSEVNMMIGGMCYALTNRLRFEIDSSTFGCAGSLGWEDYWNPIFDETRSRAFRWIVGDSWSARGKRTVQRTLRMLHPGTITKDIVWPILRSAEYNKQNIEWPELGVKGPIIKGYAWLMRMIYENLRADIAQSIRIQNELLGLPEKYVALQVRRGDKIEMNDAGAVYIGIDEFVRCINEHSELDTVFVVADDSRVISDLSADNERRWIHRIEEGSAGYLHTQFLDMDPKERKRRIIRLLADFLVCVDATFFVGTYSSNFSRSVGAFRKDEECVSMDMTWRNY